MGHNVAKAAVGAAVGIGFAGGAFEEAPEYARERQQFGKSIIHFSSRREPSDGSDRRRLRSSLDLPRRSPSRRGRQRRPLLQRRCKGRGHLDTALNAGIDAVQVMGAYGYTREFGMERKIRDAKAMQIWEGTNQAQRSFIGSYLLDEWNRSDQR